MAIEKILQSKKNANCILDLEKTLLSNDDDSILSTMDTFQELFTQLFLKNLIQLIPGLDKNEEKYRLWLIERKKDLINNLLIYLNHDNEKLQKKSLDVLLTLVKLESVNKDVWDFPKELFGRIIFELLSPHIDQQTNILRFQVYASYDDIFMYTLKAIMNILDKKEEVTDIFLTNLFYLLNALKYPDEFHTSKVNTLLPQDSLKTPFCLKEKVICKLFSNTWNRFLKFQLPFPVLKRVLLVLHKKVIPHLQNPYLLTDFLTDSYKQGGINSLLSLNSLYFLMAHYNVEYPDFFKNFYCLISKDVVNGKFSSRFFYLCDLFLSSTHLPAYLIASFAKRLSRIALLSKTDSILKIIVLVINLFIRHKTISVLIHKESPTELSEDPFVFEASDPAESHALESSLWEIKTLQNHIIPEISRKAKILNHPLPSVELDFSSTLDISLDSLYRKERKRKFEEVPLVVSRPFKTC
ncbi:nucleolar complex protein 4 homolog [Argiope bruennichi]|uniref:nucleolar complex protein 4 homolog n=1 Tax=Argiope bruennichi TaxID=94029 RepID=UPI002494DAD5|nr:nucleolar complex protein 4 homolog [Argiope bruennichi]